MNKPAKGPPPQFTLRQLFLLTTLVAVACSLSSCFGWKWTALALAPAAGAFVGALACPWIGMDYVLDNLQADVFRCLAVGFYIAGVIWGLMAVLTWLLVLIANVGGVGIFLSIGSVVLVLIGLFFVVRWLWPLADRSEIFVIATAALVAALVPAVFLPLPPALLAKFSGFAWLWGGH